MLFYWFDAFAGSKAHDVLCVLIEPDLLFMCFIVFYKTKFLWLTATAAALTQRPL